MTAVTHQAASDSDLLIAYAKDGSDEAFGRVVGRYASFVHAVATRQVHGDRHLAEDVTQAVFVVLARRAVQAAGVRSLRGWFYTTTCLTARHAVRGEQRRRRHQRSAQPRSASPTSDPQRQATSAEVLTLVESALSEMKPADRDVLVLYFVEDRPMSEVADRVALNGEATRKRVQRATGRLRALLESRGVTPAIAAGATTMLASGIAEAATAAPVISSASASGESVQLARSVLRGMRLKVAAQAAGIVVIAGLTTAAAAVVVAQIEAPSAPPSVRQATATPSMVNPSAILTNGVTVELIAVTKAGDGDDTWWRPDGTVLDGPPEGEAADPPLLETWGSPDEFRVIASISGADPYKSLKVFPHVVATSLAVGEASARVDFSNFEDADPSDPQPRIYPIQFKARAANQTVDIALKVEDDNRQVLDAIDQVGEEIGKLFDFRVREGAFDFIDKKFPARLVWSPPMESEGDAAISVSMVLPDGSYRVVAVDVEGDDHYSTEIRPDRAVGRGSGMLRLAFGKFPGLSPDRVARYELRVDPYRSVRFEHISLQPGVATTPIAALPENDGPGPVDEPLTEPLAFDGETLADALAAMETQGGFTIDVAWEAWGPQQRTEGPTRTVQAVRLPPGTLPRDAAAVVFAAAGGSDFTVTVTPAGNRLRIIRGRHHTLRADGRPLEVELTR